MRKARAEDGTRPISSLEFATLVVVPVCAFCPSTANLTGEHIWPAWLSKLLPKTRYKNERIDGEAKTTWTTTRLDQTANVVCKTCNETWMSDLEQKAKSLLTDVIVNGKQTTFGVEGMMFLAAYAFKNAVIANYQTLRLVPEPISTRAQRERFSESLTLPSDIRIWISSFQGTRDIPVAPIRATRSRPPIPHRSMISTYSPIHTSSATSSFRSLPIGLTTF
jgi:hypothetical protein